METLITGKIEKFPDWNIIWKMYGFLCGNQLFSKHGFSIIFPKHGFGLNTHLDFDDTKLGFYKFCARTS